MKWTKRLCAVLALGLAACTVPQGEPPATNSATPVAEAAAPAAVDARLMQARRAFAAAEIEWQSAIAVGRALVNRGVIRGDNATTVRGWNAQARRAIVAGKTATDVAAQALATAELLRVTGLLDAITGRK